MSCRVLGADRQAPAGQLRGQAVEQANVAGQAERAAGMMQCADAADCKGLASLLEYCGCAQHPSSFPCTAFPDAGIVMRDFERHGVVTS
jgi:hypothetical protein